MSIRHACLSLCLAALAAASPASAELRAWALDPVHTRVSFAIDHAGFSKARGAFSGTAGMLAFDPDAQDWAGAALEVDIPLASLELGDAKWNEAALARGLLDAQRHPVARFVSTRIEAIDARHAIVHGRLSLRGETRPLSLDVVLNAVKRHPLPPFRRTAGFSATATLKRSDFGSTAWASVIGDDVELHIEAEAVLARGGAQGEAIGPQPGNDPDGEVVPDPDAPPDPEPTP